MVLNSPLTVRISDGQTDRLVTHFAKGLKFSKVAPGGHQSINVQVTLPRNTFNNLGPADHIWIYDGRSGRAVIEAYLENPTPVDGTEGQSYDLSAVGGMALANDERRALIYVDKALDGWNEVKYSGAHPEGQADRYSDPDGGVLGLRTYFPRGTVLTTNNIVAVDYRAIDRAGMQLAGARIVTQSGKTDANYRAQFYDFVGASTNIGDTGQMSTTSFDQTQWIGVSITAGAVKFLLQLNRTGGAGTVADDTTWTNYTGVSVLGRRMDRTGTLYTTAAQHGSTALSVLASQVVEDLFGRIITAFCDSTVAQIDTTAFAIDQLAYPDGVTAAEVLNSLTLYEPDYLWEILETGASGEHRFNFRAWPTVPRYEVSTRDGWRQTGGELDLCNRIVVTWFTPVLGNPQTTIVTAVSAGLTDPLPGRTKDASPITLPQGFGSLANATRIGGQILADKINPPKAGTVVVRRPIPDLLTGRTVMPWEIEPGYLCRVRETGDSLPITKADFDDDSCSMVLQLGRPSLTEEQRLAQVGRTVAKSIFDW